MSDKEMVTLFGIIVSFIVGSLGLIIGVRNSKKTIFINSVTSMRAKWIDTVRESISEFCGLACQLKYSFDNNDKMERIQELRFLIRLKLNPKDKFDKKLVEKLDEIVGLLSNGDFTSIELKINDLVVLSQDMLKLEWEGVKEESKRGNLSKKFKRKLYNKYLRNKGNE
ncbi:MAG: hypothetical protein ACO1N0_12170 [Fluviicola sp.]